MPGREVTHVQHARGDHHRLRRPTLVQEPVDHPPLVEHLQRTGMEPSGSRADQHVVPATLDDADVHPRQGQLRSPHHPRRARPGDHHLVSGHFPAPTGNGPFTVPGPPASQRSCMRSPSAVGAGPERLGRGDMMVTPGSLAASRYLLVTWWRARERLTGCVPFSVCSRSGTGSSMNVVWRLRTRVT